MACEPKRSRRAAHFAVVAVFVYGGPACYRKKSSPAAGWRNQTVEKRFGRIAWNVLPTPGTLCTPTVPP